MLGYIKREQRNEKTCETHDHSLCIPQKLQSVDLLHALSDVSCDGNNVGCVLHIAGVANGHQRSPALRN